MGMPGYVVRATPATASWRGLARQYLADVDAALRNAVDLLESDWSALHPPAGDLHLPALMSRLLLRGGKQIRPVFCYLGWRAGDSADGYDDAVRAGAALELLHVFALLHDDVMDCSATRRGRLSLHEEVAAAHRREGGVGDSRRYGENIALLAGDLAYAEAERLAASFPAAMRQQWRSTVLELAAGQSADLNGTSSGIRDLDFAIGVARAKTGGYTVVRPLLLGAAAAHAEPLVVRTLTGFGRCAGEAFALRDDVLGAFGDPAATGKPSGDDLSSGKPTVLLALGHRRLRGQARGRLADAGTDRLTAERVAELQRDLLEAGVVAEVEERIAAQVGRAVDHLTGTALDAGTVGALTDLLDAVAWREA